MKLTTSVLLVAGQPPDPSLLTTVHEVLGGKAVHAASREEALWWAQQEDFAAVLIEASAARARNSLDLALQLRQQERSRHTPLLLVTDATVEVMGLFLGHELGLVDYLTKPLEPVLLRSKVAAFVELYRAREALRQQSARLHEEDTARRQSLTEERQRFFALVENSPDFIGIADVAGVPVYVNPAGRRMVGLGLEEDVGRTTLLDYYAPEAQTQAQEAIIPAMVREGRWEGETRFRNFKTGASIPVSDTHFHIQDPETGRVIGYGTITRDISEQRQDEQDRERILRELGEAVRLRDEFLSVASHELKTPLTSLSLKLQSLAREATAQAESPFVLKTRAQVETARRQIKRLADLIGDLLDVSRISSGKMKLHWEPVDFAAVVREVVARLEPEASRAESPLTVEAPEALLGRSDRMRFEQVAENLLTNAIKYGAGKPIHVRLEADAQRLTLTVRDQGIGIAPEHQARIFERFERAVSERNYGGLGLGLYITRTILESLGGSIRVQSEPGQGACFTVELPLAPSAP